jgi:hypothetical protein
MIQLQRKIQIHTLGMIEECVRLGIYIGLSQARPGPGFEQVSIKTKKIHVERSFLCVPYFNGRLGEGG